MKINFSSLRHEPPTSEGPKQSPWYQIRVVPRSLNTSSNTLKPSSTPVQSFSLDIPIENLDNTEKIADLLWQSFEEMLKGVNLFKADIVKYLTSLLNSLSPIEREALCMLGKVRLSFVFDDVVTVNYEGKKYEKEDFLRKGRLFLDIPSAEKMFFTRLIVRLRAESILREKLDPQAQTEVSAAEYALAGMESTLPKDMKAALEQAEKKAKLNIFPVKMEISSPELRLLAEDPPPRLVRHMEEVKGIPLPVQRALESLEKDAIIPIKNEKEDLSVAISLKALLEKIFSDFYPLQKLIKRLQEISQSDHLSEEEKQLLLIKSLRAFIAGVPQNDLLFYTITKIITHRSNFPFFFSSIKTIEGMVLDFVYFKKNNLRYNLNHPLLQPMIKAKQIPSFEEIASLLEALSALLTPLRRTLIYLIALKSTPETMSYFPLINKTKK